jgi:hypothetical protein
MKSLYVAAKKGFLGAIVLYFAIPAAVVCSVWSAVARLATQFANDEPLEIKPGWVIKLP